MWRVYMKKILFAASEGVPFIKTGGLADVVGSLPKYIDKEYFDVRVFIPKYTCMKQEMKDKLRYVTHFYMDFNWQNVYVGVLEAEEAGCIIISLIMRAILVVSSLMGMIPDMRSKSMHISVRQCCRHYRF